MENIIRFFQNGGPFMYIILFTLAVAIAIIIERAYYIYFKCRLDVPDFMKQLEPALSEKDYERAKKICKTYPQPVSQVALSGLRGNLKRSDHIQNNMEEKILEVLPALQRRTPQLSMIAQIATLLGLLGTIQGLIMSFKAVATAAAAEKATVLSSGISIAMNTTAFGLMVAIPCLVASAILLSRTDGLIAEIEQISLRVFNLLTKDLATGNYHEESEIRNN
ncbi:MAG: hypothetical protein B6244_10450 [Candidatus Cloacimonetes bacterium 4572_55]|nr:MAG: hypothetical protein B6244_10450 [Candidatus Cloacimonetes bacterium 4572_55]